MNETNPFLFNAQIEVIQYRRKSIEYISDPGVIATQTSVFVEREKPIKLYRFAELSALLGSLKNKCTYRLLLHIYDNIAENSDTIKLEREVIYEATGLRRTSYYDAIHELLSLQLIAKKSQNVYYINPNYLFKGDRIKFMTKRLGESAVKVVKIIETNNTQDLGVGTKDNVASASGQETTSGGSEW